MARRRRTRAERGVRVEGAGDRAELRVLDDVDLSTEPLMERLLEDAVADGAKHLVLEFCSAGFVGGPAVRLACVALDLVKPRGGTVTVRGDSHVRRLFEVTGVADRVALQNC